MDIPSGLDKIRKDATAALHSASSSAELESIVSQYMGRKGLLAELMRGIGSLPVEERPEAGKEANALKHELEQLVAQRQAAFSEDRPGQLERIDVTAHLKPATNGLSVRPILLEMRCPPTI